MRARAIIAVAALAGATLASADALPKVIPGAKAPQINVTEYVKGDAITDLSKGIHVVEFWATWCGPCKTTIPHLSALAKQYDGQVEFIGVSIWERSRENATIEKQVKDFVTEWDDRMTYNVARDTESNWMAENWMRAGERNGIPSAFIVKDGVIQWAGHPMNMDEPLAEIVSGDFNMKAFREEYLVEIMEARAMNAARAEISAAAEAKDTTKLYALAAETPAASTMAYNAIMGIRAEKSLAAARIEARKIMMVGGEDGQMAVAQYALTAGRQEDKTVASNLAEMVAMEAENPLVLYYAAAACAGCGDTAGAKMVYTKALKALDKDWDNLDEDSLRDFIQQQLSGMSGN